MIQYFANGLIFLLAVVLVDALCGRWLPYPNIPESAEKIRYLAAYGNEFDTIFIGSSRINFQVQPSLFDEKVAAQGRASKSFNAGIIGMRPPEQGFYLDQVFRQPHRRLRWVLIELTSLEADTSESRRGTARFIYWHDAPRMALLGTWVSAQWAALRSGAGSTGAGPARWSDFLEPVSVYATHLVPFAQKELNVGGATVFTEHFLLTEAQLTRERNRGSLLGEHRDGWLAYSLRETMTDQESAEYAKSYEARLAAPPEQFHDPASDAAVQAMLDATTRAGATPIFIVPPTTSGTQYYPPPDQAKNMIIWSFSDPRRYPDLFAAENRVDALHLNTAGAKQFTLALAQRFQELPANNPAPPQP